MKSNEDLTLFLDNFLPSLLSLAFSYSSRLGLANLLSIYESFKMLLWLYKALSVFSSLGYCLLFDRADAFAGVNYFMYIDFGFDFSLSGCFIFFLMWLLDVADKCLFSVIPFKEAPNSIESESFRPKILGDLSAYPDDGSISLFLT